MKSFECKKRCGYCCTLRVKLNWLDILRILKLGNRLRDFMEGNIIGRKKYLKMINGKCCFLTKKNKKSFCKIYKYRPKTCRIYPFFNKNIKDCSELRKITRFTKTH